MLGKEIFLYSIETPTLIIEHKSGVRYLNQVGGALCREAALEGVLCPIEMTEEQANRISGLTFVVGRRGIGAELADSIDEVLASNPDVHVRVDRTRLDECWEAWIHVTIMLSEHRYNSVDMPSDEEDTSLVRGFGFAQ